jgi:hypothetical protein
MKVRNMFSGKGNAVANQFEIENALFENDTLKMKGTMFQSYDSNIAFRSFESGKVYLDERYWDYSVTTSKYRNQFLGETKKETEAKIKSGEYRLINLN